jgi:dihydrofolate reductase
MGIGLNKPRQHIKSKMLVTQYNIISLDGYIASLDGEEDFIPDDMWKFFLDLCRENDTLIQGKNTYLAIQNFPDDLKIPFEQLPIKKIIVSNDQTFSPKPGYYVAPSPAEAVRRGGEKILLCSGGKLNSSFVDAKLIARIVLYILPVVLGQGIKLFDSLKEPVNLVLEKSETSDSTIKIVYNVVK